MQIYLGAATIPQLWRPYLLFLSQTQLWKTDLSYESTCGG